MNDVIELPEPDKPKSTGSLVASPTHTDLLAMAYQQKADPAVLAQFLAMKERFDELEATKAFNVAFAGFKDEGVKLLRTKLITDGPLKGRKHAELAEIINTVSPALSKHGLSMSWRLTKDEKDWMEVTCKLAHVMGHCEVVSMGGPPDAGPGRNAMQARGSTKTYLERYTGTAILGLAAGDADDDGAGGAPSGGNDPAGDRLALWTGKAVMATELSDLRKLTSAASKAFSAARDPAGYAAFGVAAQARAAVLKGAEHAA